MLTLIISMALSVLPERWRRRWAPIYEADLPRGAAVSGMAELVACVTLLIVRYRWFILFKTIALAELMHAQGVEGAMSLGLSYAAGLTYAMEYLIQPLTVVLFYFAFEGLVRFTAALVSDEVVGTMPLHLAALGLERRSKAAAEKAMGPRIADEVEPSEDRDCELRIRSCRPKPAWNHLMTVSYNDVLYEVAGQEQGSPPRPFVYLLRPKPEHKVVRGLHHYDPEELLKENG